MSGRKRAEVETVLKHAASLQDELFQRHLGRARRALDELKERSDADRKLMKQADKDFARVTREAKQLEKRMNRLYRQLRDRAERAEGVYDSWYFDEEYQQAEAVQAAFNALFNGQVRPLNQRLDQHLEALHAAELERQSMERDRAEARAALDAVQQRIRDFVLNDPLDESEALTLPELCRRHDLCMEQWTAVETALAQTVQALDADHPRDALRLARSTVEALDTLTERVEEEYRQIRQMVITARELSEALYELGYRVDSELMGRHLTEGLRVRTIQTEHQAEFEFYLDDVGESEGDDGQAQGRVQMAFNVDRLAGGCHQNTEQLMQRLQQAGIRVSVTDWGQAEAEQTMAHQAARQQERKPQ